ncbi:MAG: hypothetical protein ACKOEQ_00615 [Verrucomicrobiota bacterium]
MAGDDGGEATGGEGFRETTGKVRQDESGFPGEHWRWCPRCSHELHNERCKLRCPRCHYFMSCSDFD